LYVRIGRLTMKHVWAPWRMAYIEDDSKNDACIFCSALSRPDGPDNLILHRGRKAFVILNRYPYTSGHVMVVPTAHEASIERLDDDTLIELMHLSSLALARIRQAYETRDFNLGINIGQAAGAGIIDHVHIHIVPRWNGDTNFMSTTSDTRVLPESLEETYARLSGGWG
jgi:ATP adenylyltransferase